VVPFYSVHIIGKKFSIYNKLIYVKNKNIILHSDFVYILNPIEHQGHFVQLEILVSFKAPSGALCCSGCDQSDNYTTKNFNNPRKWEYINQYSNGKKSTLYSIIMFYESVILT
jgi:hypothetical protein